MQTLIEKMFAPICVDLAMCRYMVIGTTSARFIKNLLMCINSTMSMQVYRKQSEIKIWWLKDIKS